MKTQKFNLRLKSIALIMTAAIVLAACDKDETDDMTPTPVPQEKNIVETAQSLPQFSILVDAVVKAGLVDALSADGPFTVFAPTNDAFNALFNQLGVNGVDDLTADQLTPILLYHVVGAKVMAADVATGYVSTLNTTAPGDNSVLLFAEVGNGVKLNGTTNVTATDVEASNGVIHVIDQVLLPTDVVDIAINNSNFSILVEAVVKAGLVDALKAEGPFTVFAPTNAAFEALFTTLGVSGIADLTADQLTPILLYHVVSGNVRAADVSSGMVPTLNPDAQIDIMVSDTGVKLNGTSNVIATDVQGTNGVIHVIDAVILP
ncbi:MAG: fasciclin domain-containing protein [Bacteroidales bacterium]|jgi:transforming growth factor-beta-induced protein|nr:fasciclin domain-containing protein [Bacteroidales bacterium]